MECPYCGCEISGIEEVIKRHRDTERALAIRFIRLLTSNDKAMETESGIEGVIAEARRAGAAEGGKK